MAGIYIHIPFCKQQCTYCDFHFSTTFDSYRNRMIASFLKELELRKDELSTKQIKSIYFGGGTPSILKSEELNAILNKIKEYFLLDEGLEVTLEANPDDITIEALNDWKSGGVNRLSIGLQSFKESDLQWMNRAHTVFEAENCVELAKSQGFEHLSIDLMYGLPDLTNEEWESNIRKALDLGVDHISAYCLTVEEKTVLNKWVEQNKIKPASEDQQSIQFQLLRRTLEENGFVQYEISNFAKPGHEAFHNTNYWKGEEYLGIGPSAHSFYGNQRSWNIANNRKYMDGIESQVLPREIEVLEPEDQFNELILTGLRTIYGVPIERLLSLVPQPKGFFETLNKYKLEGLVEERNETIYLTREGRLKADRIASDLFQIK